eukprot:6333614-Prymnesium_polylepis.1
MLSRFSAGLSETLQQGATMLTERLGLSTRSLSSTFASEVSSLRSDLRLEIATLRRESVSAARAVLDDVAEQRRNLAQELRRIKALRQRARVAGAALFG